ncbi:MAG: hypothetical protein ACW98W_19610 [Candidatus Hodarchaeales archaeon]|jgi:hypothetical protein
MPGGPLSPFSLVPDASGTFPNLHVAGTRREQGMGVEANPLDDVKWELRFEMPPALPTGTAKLRLFALANATSGVAKVNPKWGIIDIEEAPSGVAGTAEGTQTVTWDGGDVNAYKEAKVVLDAATIVASGIVVMDLVFEQSGWTLSQVSTWKSSIIWE